MCEFTYTFLECNHRKQDHIDTSSCEYFDRTGVHCQPDNPQQCRERGTTVTTRNRSGICDDCIRKAEQKRLDREEGERLLKLDNEREKKARRERAEQEREEARRNKEIDDLRKQLAEQEKAKRELKQQKKAKEAAAQAEARHQDKLRLIKEEAERKQRQQDRDDEDERIRRKEFKKAREALEAANAHKKSEEEAEAADLDRQQQELDARKAALQREEQAHAHKLKQAQDASHAQGLAKRKAKLLQDQLDLETQERAASELALHLARQKAAAEAQFEEQPPLTPNPPTTPSTPHTPVDYSKLVGNVGLPTFGPYTIGGRRAPMHASQNSPHESPSPASPPANFKPAPAPVARLGGIVHAAPGVMEWKPPATSIPTTPTTPHWQASPRPRAVSNRVPSEEPVMDPVLQRRLSAQRRKCEVEEAAKREGLQTSTGVYGDADVFSTHERPDASPASIVQPQTSATSPPPPPPPPPPMTKPKPPVKPKRVSSSSSPQRTSPALEMPARIRVDSAAATPVLGNKTGDDESAWDEPDSRALRAQRLSQDKFAKQRRAGWSGE